MCHSLYSKYIKTPAQTLPPQLVEMMIKISGIQFFLLLTNLVMDYAPWLCVSPLDDSDVFYAT